MFRYTLFLVGAVMWAFASSTPAAPFFQDTFESGTIGPQWNFSGVQYGTPAILTTAPPDGSKGNPFLGEFGGAQDAQGASLPGDVVQLKLTLPSYTASVALDFDVYLLRTWDGQGVPFAGPDTFGYGYIDKMQHSTTLMSKTFSNGAGNQSYCRGTSLASCAPTFASDPAQKNQLGFGVALPPPPGSGGPNEGDAFSLVYHIHSTDPLSYGAGGPIPYAGGGDITFFFFSSGLQVQPAGGTHPVTADESWGLDNVRVSVNTVPEPKAWALMVLGLTLLLVLHRRSS
jgi:hypothetical protein